MSQNTSGRILEFLKKRMIYTNFKVLQSDYYKNRGIKTYRLGMS